MLDVPFLQPCFPHLLVLINSIAQLFPYLPSPSDSRLPCRWGGGPLKGQGSGGMGKAQSRPGVGEDVQARPQNEAPEWK